MYYLVTRSILELFKKGKVSLKSITSKRNISLHNISGEDILDESNVQNLDDDDFQDLIDHIQMSIEENMQDVRDIVEQWFDERYESIDE